MPLDENDLSFLIDIIDCIADITEFTKGISFYEFERDKMRKLAVERQLEVIGQAANKISKETQSVLGKIPWGNIIGLRNKLAHDYGEILAERIHIDNKKQGCILLFFGLIFNGRLTPLDKKVGCTIINHGQFCRKSG